jgi:membrane-associated phospholipid phosphatase
LTRAPKRSNGVLIGGGAIFIVAASLYVLLGNAVSHVPPTGIDAAARSIAGKAPGLAWVLTESCLWPVLTAFGLVGCLVAIRVRPWRGRIVFAIVTTIVAWQTSNVLKDLFARPRPAYWLVAHETSFSYSSGHAMFATIVYWLWAYHVARGRLPAAVRAPLCTALVVWGIAVIWSRLALGAHYPSDLAGGVLLGAAMLALATIVARVVAPDARVL